MSHAFSKIFIIIVILLIIVIGAYLFIFRPEILIKEGSKSCVIDEDCIIFGKTGDCKCGCYNKNDLPVGLSGKCYCAAPNSCKCVNGKCEGFWQGVADETADWKTYKNDDYGFEIKYPKDWNLGVTQPDEFSPQGNWGEQIGELAIFQSRTIGTPYCELHLTIYSNPKNLSIIDFWRERLPIVYTFKSSNNVTFGENQISGVKFSMERTDQPLPNELMAVVTKKSTNIIELFWWGQNPSVSNSDCLKVDQMLSTFRFVEKVKTATLSEFCEAKNEIMKFSSSLNFDGDSANESLVMCADSSWSEMELPGMGVLDIYVLKTINNNYQVIWQKNTDKDFNLRDVSKPEIIDIDKDGINEIIISGSNWGGTCTGSTNYTYIYSPKYNQIFSLLLSEKFDNLCQNIIKLPPEFSSNLELNKYNFFRDYLEKQVE